MSSRSEDLDAQLRAAGIPIQGISGVRANCVVVFDGEPTDQQRAQAASILAAFNWNGQSVQDTNAGTIKAKIAAAITQGENAVANWNSSANYTLAKDTALKNVVNAVAKLGRLMLSQLDSDP